MKTNTLQMSIGFRLRPPAKTPSIWPFAVLWHYFTSTWLFSQGCRKEMKCYLVFQNCTIFYAKRSKSLILIWPAISASGSASEPGSRYLTFISRRVGYRKADNIAQLRLPGRSKRHQDPEKPYSNKIPAWIIVAAVVGIGGMVTYFVVKKKRV